MANPNTTVKKFGRRVAGFSEKRNPAREAESVVFGNRAEEAAARFASGEWTEDQCRDFLNGEEVGHGK